MLENRLVVKDDRLTLLCSECGNVIGIYNANRGRPIQFCEDCIKKHRRDKDKKYYEKTNYWSSPQYIKYRKEKRKIEKFNGKRPHDYSQHLYRGNNGKSGNPNFDREQEIIRRLRNYTFKFGAASVSSVFFPYPKDDFQNLSFQLFPSECIDEFDECPICESEVFVKPIPPHSYDYSYEGFVYIYCANCGLVINQ